jgi:hypothetical protein
MLLVKMEEKITIRLRSLDWRGTVKGSCLEAEVEPVKVRIMGDIDRGELV